MTPPPSPVLRSARIADLDTLVSLEAECFGTEAWSRRLLEEELAHAASLLLVAEGPAADPAAPGAAADAAPLAYAGFRRALFAEPAEAELLRVAVAPIARRRGLAVALLAAGLDRLRAEGATACLLEVGAGNEAAIALYRRLGFRADGRRPRYYPSGADALLMRLDFGFLGGLFEPPAPHE